ncbi:MAG TPA: type II secretion system secretin GspD [Xanthobacteraceae bacterium]|jgi:general secretion pathway protein D
MKYLWAGAALLQMCLLLGCAASQIAQKAAASANVDSDAVPSSISAADLSPRYPTRVDNGTATSSEEQSTPMLYPGSAPEGAAPAPDSTAPGSEQRTASSEPVMLRGDGVEMNFEDTDIASVAKTLLGDVLHLNFQIDPRVKGSVTLASVGPIPRKDVLATFESALRMQNAALVRDHGFVKIVPLTDAPAHASISIGAGEPGFGVSVVPLRYVSATSVAKTADNLLGRADAIRVDQQRNLLLVRGTASERQAAIDVISTFDVEWLRDQSVGVYPLRSTSPDSMIQELQKVFEVGDGGPGQGVVQFEPISRMNAVMVVTKNPDYLRKVNQWVARLDRSDTSGTTVRVYRLRYGSASDVAKMLSKIFVGGDDSGASEDQPANQIAPGSSTSTSRIDSLDSGTQNNNNVGVQGGGAQVAQSPAATPIAAAFQAFDRKSAEANASRNEPGATGGGASHGVYKDVRITADTVNNAVLVYSNPEEYHVIERTLHELDRPRLEVAIDATVAEVTLTKELQYGVQYFLQGKNATVGLFGAAAQTATTAAINSVVPGFNLLLGPQSSPKAILNLLQSITDVKVLSSPSIVAMDNQPALLQVGDEVPISTGSATILSNSNTPIVNSIELYNTGVILKVLPHVNANGTIQLEIDQEVSAVVNNNTNTQTLTPTISQRRVHSTVAVTSGQTVLLGGLISDNLQKNRQGIPGLVELGPLGGLFGSIDDTHTRSEIIIFVRPQLIRNSLDAGTVTEEFRERLQSLKPHSLVTGEGELTSANIRNLFGQ